MPKIWFHSLGRSAGTFPGLDVAYEGEKVADLCITETKRCKLKQTQQEK